MLCLIAGLLNLILKINLNLFSTICVSSCVRFIRLYVIFILWKHFIFVLNVSRSILIYILFDPILVSCSLYLCRLLKSGGTYLILKFHLKRQKEQILFVRFQCQMFFVIVYFCTRSLNAMVTVCDLTSTILAVLFVPFKKWLLRHFMYMRAPPPKKRFVNLKIFHVITFRQ